MNVFFFWSSGSTTMNIVQASLIPSNSMYIIITVSWQKQKQTKRGQNWHFVAINILYSLHGFSPTSGHQAFFEYVINHALHPRLRHPCKFNPWPDRSPTINWTSRLWTPGVLPPPKTWSMANKCTKGNRNIRWTKLFKFSHCTLVALVHNSHQNVWWYRQLLYMGIVDHDLYGTTVCLSVSSTTPQTWWNNNVQQSTSWSTYGTGTPSIFLQYLHTTAISISYQATSSCFPHEISSLAVPRNLISCCAMKSRHVESHGSLLKNKE